MIKGSPHITLTEEQDKRETVICIVWASVVVFGMLALMLHGFAFLSWTEVTNKDIYARQRMDQRLDTLNKILLIHSDDIKELKNHTHVYSTGKPKGGD